VAVALGFFIGLQREHSHGGGKREIFAGERTFSLLALAGALAAMAADELKSPLIFLGLILFVTVLSGVAYFVEANARGRIGMTTEVAVLVTVFLGGLSYWGYLSLAAALGIGTTLLLSIKLETDRFVRSLTREDLFAILQFAAISAIILPVLPTEVNWPEPFNILVPFNIWLMVVLISGIGFLGYVLNKIVGAERGLSLTGLLGGLVSSTAVTLSFSKLSRSSKKLAKSMALAIIISWTMMFARVLVEVAILNPQLLQMLWLPLLAGGISALIYSSYMFFAERGAEGENVKLNNPFDLLSAIKFGLLYGLILLIVHSTKLLYGDPGVLVASFFSGLLDVDAIALSMSELSRTGEISLDTASQAIVIAVTANTLVKGSIVVALGSKQLRRAILPGVLVIVVVILGAAFIF
jgi:uncharacterized membrane protein (DUF4010 family)